MTLRGVIYCISTQLVIESHITVCQAAKMLQGVDLATAPSRCAAVGKALGKRKQTAYEVRKERKRALVEQVDTIQRTVDQLKLQLLTHQGNADQAVKRTEAENKVLLQFIQEQHLALAKTQAAPAVHAVCIRRRRRRYLARRRWTNLLIFCLRSNGV